MKVARCDAMRGAHLSGKVGTRHARPDKRMLPAAIRSKEAFSLSKIAGMAHSTLKSGAATHDERRLRVPEGPGETATRPRNLLSCLCQIRQRMWPISFAIRCEWINGQDLN